MKKMAFENASLELIRFNADVITSSGGGYSGSTDTYNTDNDNGDIREYADNPTQFTLG